MKEADIVVIGGNNAGHVAAEVARKYYKDAKIVLIRKEKVVLCPCGIPYIFGTLKSPEQAAYSDRYISEHNIDLIIDEVTSIDRDKKTITTLKGETIGYKKLVLATGSQAIVPPIPGVDLENVFVAKKDIDYLRGFLEALDKAKNVVTIGGGFIGVEFSDEFRKRGLDVTIIEMLPHCLQLVFDLEFCIMAENKLRQRGIKLMTNTRAKAIIGDRRVEGVELGNGEKIPADIVLLGIGMRPNTELAQKAGLKIGETRAIWVDEYGRTSDEDIFAVGDCAEKRSFFTGKPIPLGLASIATNEARVAAANLFGIRRKNMGAVGAFSTIIGDSGMGKVGLSEKEATDLGFEITTGETIISDKHPPAMPNSKEISMKLVFEKASKRILGAQIFGGSSVGEIVNILSVFIQKKMTAEEMALCQVGTHPAFTPPPPAYHFVTIAEEAA